jgi:GAF domain-containing protein
MIVFEVGGITYLSNSSLRAALRQVSETSHELELARRNLTQRVEMRTAELSDRAEQFRTIAELNQATSSVGDVDTLLTTVVELIARRLGFYHVGVFVLDPEGEWAVLQAASSEGGRRMIERGHRLRVGQQGIVGHVAEMGTARLAFDVGEDAVWFNNPDLPETQSEMALPLIANQRIIGVMDIQSEEAAAFDEDDVETLRVLANGVANSLANTRLLEETQRTVAQLERYQRENAVRAWRQALARRNLRVGYRYQSGMVQAVDGDDGAARLVEQAEDIALEPTEDGQYRLLAPISVGGRRLGLLSFVRSSPWTEETVQLVESVTNQLDLALDNARLLEETRLRATQEAARSDIVGRVRALTSTDAILRSAAEELGRALQVERSRIQLIQFNE